MTADDRSKMSVMLTCRDVKASAAFYRELGFHMKESWPSDDEPQWANMVLVGQSIMIGACCEPDKVDAMCGGNEKLAAYWRGMAEAFAKHPSGVGVQVYVEVEDVDAFHARVQSAGLEPATDPTTQFYGIRDFGVDDPDGYGLVFYTPVAMESCQSCGMPLADAEPGQMYCGYCTDEHGTLKPYEVVFEGTVQGYFMGMQKMPRDEAEKAAAEHLKQMPAWSIRS